MASCKVAYFLYLFLIRRKKTLDISFSEMLYFILELLNPAVLKANRTSPVSTFKVKIVCVFTGRCVSLTLSACLCWIFVNSSLNGLNLSLHHDCSLPMCTFTDHMLQ